MSEPKSYKFLLTQRGAELQAILDRIVMIKQSDFDIKEENMDFEEGKLYFVIPD